MSTSGLPSNVDAFLLRHVDSLEQLEVLLLLRRDLKTWTAVQVAAELRSQKESVANRLRALASAGIVIEDGGGYRYAPKEPSVDRDVAEVAGAYTERRVAVINFIATKHLERIRSFASAFKFKDGQ